LEAFWGGRFGLIRHCQDGSISQNKLHGISFDYRKFHTFITICTILQFYSFNELNGCTNSVKKVSVTLWFCLQRRCKTFFKTVSVTLWLYLQRRRKRFCFVCFCQPALWRQCLLVLWNRVLLVFACTMESCLITNYK